MTYRSIAAIIIVRLIGELASDFIIHSLEVLLLRDKVLRRNITTLQVEVGARTTSDSETSPEKAVGGFALLRSLGRVAPTRGAEGLRGEGEASATSGGPEGRSDRGRTEEGPGGSSRGGSHGVFSY